MHYSKGIPQNHLTFALFDPSKMGNLMTPGKKISKKLIFWPPWHFNFSHVNQKNWHSGHRTQIHFNQGLRGKFCHEVIWWYVFISYRDHMNHMYTEKQGNIHHSHSEYTLLEFAMNLLGNKFQNIPPNGGLMVMNPMGSQSVKNHPKKQIQDYIHNP